MELLPAVPFAGDAGVEEDAAMVVGFVVFYYVVVLIACVSCREVVFM